MLLDKWIGLDFIWKEPNNFSSFDQKQDCIGERDLGCAAFGILLQTEVVVHIQSDSFQAKQCL